MISGVPDRWRKEFNLEHLPELRCESTVVAAVLKQPVIEKIPHAPGSAS
jgi:hypothetical protein